MARVEQVQSAGPAGPAGDALDVLVLGSGSSGNAVLVESAGTRVLVDAGLGPRVCAERLRSLGVDLFPRGVDALVVTHEHGDHAAHVLPLARALKCPLWLHAGIRAPKVRARFADAVVPLHRGEARRLGALVVEISPLPHDAPNVAVRISGPFGAFAYATDLGHAPRGLAAFLGASDLVLLEANHCEAMLSSGPYPERLKQRISCDTGHLSNEQAGTLVAAMAAFGAPLVALCHLSRTNNTPERALAAVRARAPRAEVRVLDHGVSERLVVRAASRRPPIQLSLTL